MRAKDSIVFENIYQKFVSDNKTFKRSRCYELAEEQYFSINGFRKYSKYANFRSVISRRRAKNKKLKK